MVWYFYSVHPTRDAIGWKLFSHSIWLGLDIDWTTIYLRLGDTSVLARVSNNKIGEREREAFAAASGAFLIFTFEFADYGTRQFSFQLFSPQTISNNSWKFFFSTCPGFYSSFRNIYFFFIFFVFALWIHIFLIAFISCYIVCLFFPLSFRRLAQVFFFAFLQRNHYGEWAQHRAVNCRSIMISLYW